MRGPCVWETCSENKEAGSQWASGVGAHLSTERQPDSNCVSELKSAKPVHRRQPLTQACYSKHTLESEGLLCGPAMGTLGRGQSS